MLGDLSMRRSLTVAAALALALLVVPEASLVPDIWVYAVLVEPRGAAGNQIARSASHGFLRFFLMGRTSLFPAPGSLSSTRIETCSL